MERFFNGDTAITNARPRGFQLLGDFMTLAYTQDPDPTFVIARTNSDGYSATSSTYESVVFNAGDSSKKKDLLGITVTTEPMPAAGQIILGYKTDAQTSFTAIFTDTTDNQISFSAITGLPKDYKEIQFQILSTGNAVPTGFSFREKITGKRIYG